MARLVAMAGLVIGLAALALQFAISVPAAMAVGKNLGQSIVFYVSFFTILTNSAAVLVYASALFDAGRLPTPFYGRPRVRAGIVVAMVVVSLVYISVLQAIWNPQGLFLVADVILHYVTPTLFVAWWVLYAADGSTSWRDIPWWLVYPTVYLLYVMVRAPLAGEVPYPFLDIPANGLPAVIFSTLLVLGLFLVVSALAILADHGVSRLRKPDAQPTGQLR
jgi:hypothetical protein